MSGIPGQLAADRLDQLTSRAHELRQQADDLDQLAAHHPNTRAARALIAGAAALRHYADEREDRS